MLDNIDVLVHSCVRIESDDPAVVMYFDPFALDVEPRDGDVIFVTHDHHDHFSPEDVARVAKDEAIIVCPKTSVAAVEAAGWPSGRIVGVAPGDSGEVCGIAFEAVAAYNVGKQFHPKENAWVGFVVTVGGQRCYVAGDTDANEDNLKVACDVAIVPAGGTYTFTAQEAAEFVNKIGPAYAIPTHYGNIVGVPEDGPEFARNVREGIEVVLKL